MPTTKWLPVEATWGDCAFREIMVAFDIHTRSVALCAWLLVSDHKATKSQADKLAADDPEIVPTKAGGPKITTRCMSRARMCLGIETPRAKKAKKSKAKKRTGSASRSPRKRRAGLSEIEKAVLAHIHDCTVLVENYILKANDIRVAQEAFDEVRSALQGMPQRVAMTLADASPLAAEILGNEGVLDEKSVAANDVVIDPYDEPYIVDDI